MKKIIAAILAVLMFTTVTFAGSYVRYDSQKQYPWYGKYISYNYQGLAVKGSEDQYTDMVRYYNDWQDVKTLQARVDLTYYSYLTGHLSYTDTKSTLNVQLKAITEITSRMYGVDPNDWISDNIPVVQAAHDVVQNYAGMENTNFIHSVYAEYTKSVALSWRAVMTRDQENFRQYAAGSWGEQLYYSKMLQTLCDHMLTDNKGFHVYGDVAAAMKALLPYSTYDARDLKIQSMGGGVPAEFLKDPDAKPEPTLAELHAASIRIDADLAQQQKDKQARIAQSAADYYAVDMEQYAKLLKQHGLTPDGYDTKGFWYDKPGFQYGALKYGMTQAQVNSYEGAVPYHVDGYTMSSDYCKLIKVVVHWPTVLYKVIPDPTQ